MSLSPDAKSIAWMTNGDSLKVIPLDGSNPTTVSFNAGMMVQDAAWAPNGKQLYVSGLGFGKDNFGLGLVDLGGKFTLLWSSQNAWLAPPRVSRDGKHLAFGYQEYDSDLFLLEADATGVPQ